MTSPRHPHLDVREFHRTYGQAIGSEPAFPSPNVRAMRRELLREETEELDAAEAAGDLIGIADALADIVYVTFGHALAYGIPLDLVLAEVHRSNMSKLDPTTGQPILRMDGKVLKGSAYTPPDVAGILQKSGVI